MPTLTLELPDAAYHAALALPETERVRRATFAFIDDEGDGPDYDRETDEDDLAAIGRSLEDEAAGRIIPGDIALARFRQQFKRNS